jgi:hypothetical protein
VVKWQVPENKRDSFIIRKKFKADATKKKAKKDVKAEEKKVEIKKDEENKRGVPKENFAKP